MSEYPDWQADNEPMRAALARMHHLQRTMGHEVPEAKEQFLATLQDAYFLIPRLDDVEESGRSIGYYFEPIEEGVILSVFSSLADARNFFGEEYQLHYAIQGASDFFSAIVDMAESLESDGHIFVGVVIDRASDNFYYFNVAELVTLSAGGRVIGSEKRVNIDSDQIQVVAIPESSPLSPQLTEALRSVMNEALVAGVSELWAFWLTINGRSGHLGLALACENTSVLGQLGPLFEEKWDEAGDKYGVFDLIPLVGPHEAAIRATGKCLWRAEPPKNKRSLWGFLKPK